MKIQNWKSIFIAISHLCLFYFSGISQTRLLQYPWQEYYDIYNWNTPTVEEAFSDTILTLLGRWAWGPCLAVNTLGNLAYIGNGPTLHILDISNPTSPEIVGEYLTDGLVVDIEIKGTLAYLLTGKLEIFDIQDPINPVKLGEVNLFGGTMQVVVEDSLAFVTCIANLIYAVDVSNPGQPVIRDVIAAGGEFPNCLAAKGNYAYVGNREWPFLIIVDATDPDNLIWAAQLYIGASAESAVVRDTLLYLGIGGLVMKIYSISNPASPMQLGAVSIPLPGSSINAITVVDHYAYLSTPAGIFSVNVSSPSLPVLLGNIKRRNGSLQGGLAIAYANGNALGAYDSGLWIVDVSQPDSLKDVSFFPTSDHAYKVVLRDDLAFIASGWSGLWIIDISQPEQPERIANLNTGGWTAHVVVSDNLAYIINPKIDLSDTTYGLRLVDISDIQHPYIVSYVRGRFYSLALSDNLLFLTSAVGDTALEILDVSNSQNPQLIGVLHASYDPSYIALQDSFAYLATPANGLRIIDWHNPSSPVEVYSFNTSNIYSVVGIAVSDSFAYADRIDTFFVFNISNPYSPEVMGKFGRNYGSFSSEQILSADQDYVYWAQGYLGVVDVSDPYAPREVELLFGQGSSIRGVAAKEGVVVAANAIFGIWIFQNNYVTFLEDPVPDIIPKQFELYQNFPNPFNPLTTIEFYSSVKERVIIEVFNMLGQKVQTLFEGTVKPGNHRVSLYSSSLPSGVYFYQLKAGGISLIKKMVLLR